MAGKRDKPEEIVLKLRQVEVLQGQGSSIADAVRQIGVTQQMTRAQAFGEMPQSIGVRARHPHRQAGHTSLPFTLSRSCANPAMLSPVGRRALLLVASVRLRTLVKILGHPGLRFDKKTKRSAAGWRFLRLTENYFK